MKSLNESEKELVQKLVNFEAAFDEFVRLAQDLRIMVRNHSEIVGVYPEEVKQTVLTPSELSQKVREINEKKDAYEAVCDDCGATTTVKFKPNPKWPIRCLSCYKKHMAEKQNE